MRHNCVYCSKVTRCEKLKEYLNDSNIAIISEYDGAIGETCDEFEESDFEWSMIGKSKAFARVKNI